MLPSVTGITLESLLPSTNRRLTHDTRQSEIPLSSDGIIYCRALAKIYNAVGRQGNLGLDTRIHRRHSEYDQLRIFYLLFSYETIQICQFRCFEIKNKPYQSLFFLNKHYLLLFVITALLSECLLLSEALHKQNKKSWYTSIDTILKYLKINVSAKFKT